MKGKLINKDQKWIVQYEEVDNTSFGIAAATGGTIIPSVKELPLHPDDVYSSSLVIGKNGEIEFEIVEEVIDLGRHGSTIGKYAKLIQPKEDNFKSVREGIRQSTKQSGYSVYIPENAKKQEETKVTREETTTWEDILVTISNFQSKDPHKMDLVDWLKKHYNVPTKKK